MKFVSTRGQAPAVGLSAAIAAGLAPDGGLYVPERVPTLSVADFADCDSLATVTARLLAPYFAEDALAPSLDAMCAEALDFATPLVPAGDDRTCLLELFHGPTAAFKDVGARFLAAALQRIPRARDLTVVVATSGDTGAAVAAAFHDRPGLRVAVLYPDGRVSPRQAHQLGAFGGNVSTYRVAGSFDDCQRMVKQALADTSLQAQRPLSSANSISLGRLLPQMGYYALAALRHWRARGEPLNFMIPTGNLGNAFAAVLAREMGLPIGRIALACNANRALPDFFAGGEYRATASIATLANAMDVGAPSNFERLRWWQPDAAALRQALDATTASDDDIRHAIADADARAGRVICPHTAAAWHALALRRQAGDSGDWAVVATAHPAKFETVVEPIIGRPVPVPSALTALLARPAPAEHLPADAVDFRARLLA